jgi:hypothetical protein
MSRRKKWKPWNGHKDIPYYGDRDEYTGHGTDDGVDACKDANAEMGLPPYHPAGFHEAKRLGWIKKKPKDDSDI